MPEHKTRDLAIDRLVGPAAWFGVKLSKGWDVNRSCNGVGWSRCLNSMPIP